VAWIIRHEDIGTYLDFHALTEDERNDGYSAEALYTQPSKQTCGGGYPTLDGIAWSIVEKIPAIGDLSAQYQQDIHAAILAALSTNEVDEHPGGAAAVAVRS